MVVRYLDISGPLPLRPAIPARCSVRIAGNTAISSIQAVFVPCDLPCCSMKSRLGLAVLLFATMMLQAQAAKQWKLDVGKYGLSKPKCVWEPQQVDFLDNDHLVISAAVAYSCSKSDRDRPTETRITVIDLQGHELAQIDRADVIQMLPGPIGYVTICTGDRVELLSRNLQVAWSTTLSENGKSRGCYFGGGLSPSRTAMIIAGPANSQFRLYQVGSNTPIAEITTAKGQWVRAVADGGFLICAKETNECDVVGSHGVLRSFQVPVLGGTSGYYIVGLVAPDRLLLASFDGKHLYAETPTGETVSMGDIAKIKPPFIDSSEAEMSAAEPRRILYRVDGCLLGDFDDCYGVVFRRFAIFDSQTSRMIFRHSYAPGAKLKISPNGHLVMEQDDAEIHLYQIP